MKVALILCSYSKDPKHALRNGKSYREELSRRGIVSACPVLDLDDLWREGKITMETIENAVESMSRSCTEIIIIEKEGKDVQGVVLESLGLMIEMRKFCDIMPVYYGLTNYFQGNVCNKEVKETICT